MSSRHLVDPELLSGLEIMPAINLSNEELPLVRQLMNEMLRGRPADEGLAVDVDEQIVPAPDGHAIGTLLFKPRDHAKVRPAILHVHGGGYVMGTARIAEIGNRALAAAADCIILSVDYRLAPETRHPGPVEDCYAALKWLHANADALGADRNRIAVVGESAGGGLAASLALLARDRGEIPLIHQHLIYPMIDDRVCTEAPHPFAGEFVWTSHSNRFGWASLLGAEPGGSDVSPYASPARAADLSGLPPAFICVGALDLFLEQDVEYARRLIRAGVATELHVYPGAYHGFDIVPEATVTLQAKQDSLNAITRAFRRHAGASANPNLG